MKIFLISQDINNGYDTYDSAIVIAENEEEAKKTHPENYIYTEDGWIYIKNNGEKINIHKSQSWVDVSEIDKIKVDYIGEAKEGSIKGVVCASYNAG